MLKNFVQFCTSNGNRTGFKSSTCVYNTLWHSSQRSITGVKTVKTDSNSHKQSNRVLGSSKYAFIGLTSLVSVPLALYAFYNHENEYNTAQASEFNEHDQRIKQLFAENNSMKNDGKPPIYKIVLTGGPCGGKSTALSIMSDRLRSFGFRVFIVPEAATIVITGGGIYKDMNHASTDQK